MTQSFSIPPELRHCAQALAGNVGALTALANSPQHEALILSNRLAPALAIRASDLGVEGPQLENWILHMRHNAVLRMRLEAARREVGEVLFEADIPWAPIKGLGLDPTLYPRPEERISTDLDVLVSPDNAVSARDQLIARGWRSNETTGRCLRYVTDEGYNWHLGSPGGLALELHFRLWGGVPEELAADFLERTQPAPDYGPTARRLDLPDSYLIAAVHVWQTPPPRYLFLWWDLHQMAGIMDDDDVRAVISRAKDHGLQAFIALSAGTAADFWYSPGNQSISDELTKNLRPSERWAASSLRKTPPATASLGTLTLGRLLANRPSRSGWRAIPRQIWAHPGTVETNTPEEWPWPKRRLTHLARKLHLIK